jgi:exodeoxyribonuclease VII small subunit
MVIQRGSAPEQALTETLSIQKTRKHQLHSDSQGGCEMAARKASFEDVLQEINDITKTLESEEQPLEDAVSTYARGIAAIKLAQDRLSSAEQQVRVLMGDAEQDDSPEEN